jgi:hypothetical protein
MATRKSSNLKFIFLILIGIIVAENSFSQGKAHRKYIAPETIPLFSRFHTLSIHVRDTITQDSVFHFLVEKLKLPVYYFPVKYGTRKYAGVYAGNIVLEPCGPYSVFSYASNNFRAIFFGLTFEPFKTIPLSAKGFVDRKIPHEEGESYIYIKDSTLCSDNITISFMDKGLGRIEDKRIMDSLLFAMTKDTENELGIEYVKEIWIGYKDNTNLQKWKELISPDKLANNKIWAESNILEFHLIKSRIKEVQGITFKVKSLEIAKQYLLKNNLLGDYIDSKIILNKNLTFGLRICITEKE